MALSSCPLKREFLVVHYVFGEIGEMNLPSSSFKRVIAAIFLPHMFFSPQLQFTNDAPNKGVL